MKPPLNSPAGVERLDRDVLSHSGVTHVILFLGTNDIRREAPAAQVIDGIKDIIARVKQKGIKIIGVTIIPRDSVVPGVADTGWNDAKTKIRNEVNDWIRKRGGFRRRARLRQARARPRAIRTSSTLPTTAATACIPRRSAIS